MGSIGGPGRDCTETSSSVSPRRDSTLAVRTSPEGTKPNDSEGFTPPSFVLHSEDARILSLDTALDPRSLGGKSSSEKADSSLGSGDSVGKNDPIHLRLLNRPSAQHLYEGYFTHFEYNVGFLDPVLYTFDYTRQRSSFLFTVLMSISARVFRPDLAPVLRNHAETLLGKVLLSCEAEIENIWAIVCMYYWKELGDKRGYTLIGFAMRLAAASDWHGGRRNAYTGFDETTNRINAKLREVEARKLRDQDRAWLYLGSLDRTLSFFTDRPIASIIIAPDLGCRGWLRTSNPWTYPFGDARAMAGQELTDIAKPVHDYICSTRTPRSRSDDTSDLSNAIHKLNDDLIAWSAYWAPIFVSHETSVKILESQIYMYGNQIRTYFNSILLHRVLESTGNCVTSEKATDAIRACYTTALNVLREAINFGKMEVLYYLWDTAHLMIAYAAMVLLKLLKQAPYCPGVSVQEAYSVLQEAADVHTSAARSLSAESNQTVESVYTVPATTTVEAQARLLKSILFRIKADTIPPSLRPAHHSSAASSGEAFDNLLPLLSYQGTSSSFPQLQLQPESSGEAVTTGCNSNVDNEWNEAQQMAELTNEMDLSLDSSFIENWFTQAGLLPWDEPGIFKEPR
ncbi:hypothetical protein J3458_013438 [Metarhizium acridum]|uniref:uncharacterized protein n=1 Tax=Metarhizium acridum TaxID=92637 RepID=UPI001C6CF571|nr:hypothetical protein J3458_013438 [Metarhizium acridum]